MKIQTESYIFDRKLYDVKPYSKTIRVVRKKTPKFKGNKRATKTVEQGVKIVQGVSK